MEGGFHLKWMMLFFTKEVLGGRVWKISWDKAFIFPIILWGGEELSFHDKLVVG